jgi:hypothetical protein
LDRPDIDTRFEQVGRETVAQRMDPVAVRDPRALLGMIGDLLGCADGHRHLGIAARQQPRAWPVALPGGAQLGEQTGGEQRRAILAAFPWLDTEQHAPTFAIREPQPDDCTDTQACGVRGHQEDAVPRILRLREQALEFFNAEDLGELGPPRPWREVEVEDVPAQRLGRKELQSRRRLIARTPREAPLDEEMVQGGTNVLRAQAIGRARVAFG